MLSMNSVVLALVAVFFVGSTEATIGNASYHTTAPAIPGACGSPIATNEFAVAVSPAEFDDGAVCGQAMTVTFENRNIVALVLDECSACSPGDIDLTEPAFLALSPNGLAAGLLVGVDYTLE